MIFNSSQYIPSLLVHNLVLMLQLHDHAGFVQISCTNIIELEDG